LLIIKGNYQSVVLTFSSNCSYDILRCRFRIKD